MFSIYAKRSDFTQNTREIGSIESTSTEVNHKL